MAKNLKIFDGAYPKVQNPPNKSTAKIYAIYYFDNDDRFVDAVNKNFSARPWVLINLISWS